VIILATNRSDEESHPRKSLGLLVSRQRLNGWSFVFSAHIFDKGLIMDSILVAISRAQSLLIVIGDPEVLRKYEHWHTFLKYIKTRKGWTGKMHDLGPDEAAPPPGCEIVSRKGGVVFGDEFIDGKSEKIYRYTESSRR